jgi:hypothetical protein
MEKPCSGWLLPFMETLNLVQTGFKSESSFYVNFSNVFSLHIFCNSHQDSNNKYAEKLIPTEVKG